MSHSVEEEKMKSTAASIILVCLLLGNWATGQQAEPAVSNGLPLKYNGTVLPGESGECPSAEQRDAARVSIAQDVRTLTKEKVLPVFLNASGCGCGGPGWTRVAYLDMTDPIQNCPDGWNEYSSPRACGRPYTPVSGTFCERSLYSTQGIEYSEVCGRVKGYQFGQTMAFVGSSIETNYVHGVSITHSTGPRQHIWTFASAYSETQTNSFVCPYTNINNPTTEFNIPTAVGEDYFCDTGVRDFNSFSFFTADPLWDGEGCGATSTCCSFNGPPFFCKQLPAPTTDDIEVRNCGENPNFEDTAVEQLEIYVK